MGDPGFIDMDTAVVAAAMTVLERRGQGLDEDWDATTGAIRAEEPAIGLRDPMAHAFSRGYRPDAQVVRGRAGQLPAAYDRLVAAGRESVRLYAEADARAATTMPR